MILDRASILTADDLKTKDVPVPEWGGDVRVRSLTGTQRDEFGRSLVGADGKPDSSLFNVKLCAISIVGENRQPLFTLDDLQALGDKSAPVLARIADAAGELNKIAADAVEVEKGN